VTGFHTIMFLLSVCSVVDSLKPRVKHKYCVMQTAFLKSQQIHKLIISRKQEISSLKPGEPGVGLVVKSKQLTSCCSEEH